jgi:hypothetical protein
MPQISPFVRNHSWALAKPPQERLHDRVAQLRRLSHFLAKGKKDAAIDFQKI